MSCAAAFRRTHGFTYAGMRQGGGFCGFGQLKVDLQAGKHKMRSRMRACMCMGVAELRSLTCQRIAFKATAGACVLYRQYQPSSSSKHELPDTFQRHCAPVPYIRRDHMPVARTRRGATDDQLGRAPLMLAPKMTVLANPPGHGCSS
jgi:hypothetical protein